MEKTVKELQHELAERDRRDGERKENDNRYAMKIVERIVFAQMALITLGVLGALLNLVVKNYGQ